MSRKKTRKLLLIFFALIFFITLGVVGWRLWNYHKGDQAYSEAENLVNLPDFESLALPSPTIPDTAVPSPAPTADAAPSGSVSPDSVPDTDPDEEEQPVYVDPYATCSPPWILPPCAGTTMT